ncbi:hypothetical protein GCM10027612_66010 [Microbispora bryophytorum subsp. camponoti]
MDLPESARGDPEFPLAHPLGQRGPATQRPRAPPALVEQDRGVHVRDVRPAARDGFDDHCTVASGGGHHLDRGGPRPGQAFRADLLHGGVRDEALGDVLDVVRPVPPQPRRAVPLHSEPHAGAPPEAVLRPRHLLDHDLEVEARQAPELLGDHVGLEPALRLQRRVLPVAAAAAAGAGERAGRRDPVG